MGPTREGLRARPTRYRKLVLTSWDRDSSGYAARPTRYHMVVLTSWNRRMSDCERDPPATAWWY
jgi:hypothetical protein